MRCAGARRAGEAPRRVDHRRWRPTRIESAPDRLRSCRLHASGGCDAIGRRDAAEWPEKPYPWSEDELYGW